MVRLCWFIYITGVEVVKISSILREILFVGFWLCEVLFLSGIIEAADHPALQPVKELFAAMSKHDGKAMRETSTEDFQLLEHGEDCAYLVGCLAYLMVTTVMADDTLQPYSTLREPMLRRSGRPSTMESWA